MKKKILWQLLIYGMLIVNAIAQPVIKTQKQIGGSAYDESRCYLKTKDGGLLVAGKSWSNKSGVKTQNTRSPGDGDYWIVKMDKNGKIEWDKTIGGVFGDYLASAIQTSDGGYALIGASNSVISVEKDEDSRGDVDYWMVKLDKSGNIQWNKTIGGSGADFIDYIRQTSDDGYILAGSSGSNISGEKTEDSRGDVDYWVVKLNKAGKKVWDKTIGGSDADLCSGLVLTKDGGVALAGFSLSNKSGEKSEDSRGSFDLWVVKLNKSGKIEWDKTVGGSDLEYCHSMIQTDDGGYLIGGNSFSNISGEKSEDNRGDGSDYWLIKLDRHGNKTWDKTIGGNHDDADVWSLLQTEDKGYILGGNSTSDISGEKTEASRGGNDYWIVKLDKNLNIQWDKTAGGSDADYNLGSSIQEIEKNIYVLGGTSWSQVSGDKTIAPVGEADYWLVILDASNCSAAPAHSNNTNAITAKPKTIEQTFTAFPNPVRDILYVHTNGKTTLALTNQSGKQVLVQTIENNGTINVAGLPAGMYYLSNNAGRQTQKITITK